MKWEIGDNIRCDIVGYAAKNMSGKRQQAQFYPSGASKGGLDGSCLSSLVIRALPGTRVLLAVSTEDYRNSAWRVVDVLEGSSVRSKQANGLPGVRIPDLDLLNPFDSKKTEPDFESSYPFCDSIADGSGWTFGGPGGLKNRVNFISISRADQAATVSPIENALREMVRVVDPGAVRDKLVKRALELLGPDGAKRFQSWVDSEAS